MRFSHQLESERPNLCGSFVKWIIASIVIVELTQYILNSPSETIRESAAKEVSVNVQINGKYIKKGVFSAGPTLLLMAKDKSFPAVLQKVVGDNSRLELQVTPQTFQRFNVGESAIFTGGIREYFVDNAHLEKLSNSSKSSITDFKRF
jgi:hypothetical protein